MIETKPMLPDQWQLHKAVRCAALAEAPYAYCSTLESALKRSDEDWMRITRQVARDPNNITLFAFEIEVLCGTVACVIEGNEAEMFAVWVYPAHRRKGVGIALIEYARDWSKLHGAAKIDVGVYDDKPYGLVFYRSAGFTDCGIKNQNYLPENELYFCLPMNRKKLCTRLPKS